jgi:disulfide bond formation protein DsbB
VFLYSQLFIFGLAWYKNDRKIFDYTLLLSIMGFIVATYQSYLQLGYSELLPCPVVASTIDCAKPTFIEYGFVTFPFMAVVLFAFLIILSFEIKRSTKKF